MASANELERARKDGVLFGIPMGDLGWFSSLIIGIAVGVTGFFFATFCGIVALAVKMAVTHRTPDFAIAYNYIGLPVGIVVMVLALGYLCVQWVRRLTRKGRVA